MRFLIEFLCRSIFKELVAWEKVNTFVNELKETGKFKPDELWLIRIVAYFSAFIHRNEVRADGTKYITHPLAVAKILVFEFLVFDVDAILAAILHDNAENSGWSWGVMFLVIEKISNEHVADLVFYLSKHRLDEVHVRYYEIMRILRIMRVILIKLADRTHNMRTLEHMKKESRIRKIKETEKFFPSYLVIVAEDILKIENKKLADSIVERHQLSARCESVFKESLKSAKDKLSKSQ